MLTQFRLKHPRLALNSVSLNKRRKLPHEPGIYLLISFWEVAYVGMSTNLFNRWNGYHHKIEYAQLLPLPRLYYLPLNEWSDKRLKKLETKIKHHYQAKNQAKWNDITVIPKHYIWELWRDLVVVVVMIMMSLLMRQMIAIWLIFGGFYFCYEGRKRPRE